MSDDVTSHTPAYEGQRSGGLPPGRSCTWRLLRADVTRTLAAMAPASADVIWSDPPYFVQKKGAVTVKSGKRAKVDHGAWDQPAGGIEGELAFHRAWLHAAKRVLKPTGTIWACANYVSVMALGFAIRVSGFRLLNVVSWYKPNAGPNLGCRQLTHSQEFLIWASLGPDASHHFDYGNSRQIAGGKQLRDVWEIPAGLKAHETSHGKHPTQKPVELIDRAMAISAPAGGLVVDPFCGVASAGVSALSYGCDYVGIDLDPSYLEVGAKRLGWR